MKSNLTPENMGQAGVYLLQNSETGETYVGSTGQLGKRFLNHRQTLLRGDHQNKNLQAAFNTNSNFEFIATPVESKLEAQVREQAILDQQWGNPLILNLARYIDSPMRGVKQSPEHVEKRRDKQLGRVTSRQTKQLLSQAWDDLKANGFKRDPVSMAPALAANKKKVLIEGQEFESLTAAAKAHGIAICTVAQRINSTYFPEWLKAGEVDL